MTLLSRFSVRIGRPALAASLVAFLPGACGQDREAARLAALEAGLASAQAGLSALSATSAASPVAPGPAADLTPYRPVAAATTAAARTAAAARTPLRTGGRPIAASELLGSGPGALDRWFGEPDLRRPEGDAEVRLYLGPGCALDLVLYAGAGGMRVAHAAARADGASAVTEADCLRGIGTGVGPDAPPGHIARR